MLFDIIVFFFFFQAEDGIRDLTVTGVQTCALPISAMLRPAISAATPSITFCCTSGVSLGVPRSEERRVGKECRSPWLPDHCKKKSARQRRVVKRPMADAFDRKCEVDRAQE